MTCGRRGSYASTALSTDMIGVEDLGSVETKCFGTSDSGVYAHDSRE